MGCIKHYAETSSVSAIWNQPTDVLLTENAWLECSLFCTKTLLLSASVQIILKLCTVWLLIP